MKEYCIALDIGTTGCKAALFDNYGNNICASYIEVNVNSLGDDFIEQDVQGLWDRSIENIKILLKQIDKTEINKIKSISLCSQGLTVIPIDANGNILRPAISWLDGRAVKETEFLEKVFGNEIIFKITGKNNSTIYSLPKILWIRNNEPGIFNKVFKFLLPLDFIVYKLTGKFVTDPTMASGTLLYDINEKKWSQQILSKLNLSKELFPDIYWAGTDLGIVKKDISKILNISENTKVIMGCQDQKCGALGAGIDIDKFCISLGTASAICALSSLLTENKKHIPIGPFLTEELMFLEEVVVDAGASLKWYRETFGYEEKIIADEKRINFYEYMDIVVENTPIDLNGVCFYPHLSKGTGIDKSSVVKGAFIGLTLSTKKDQIIRSIYEGIAFQIKKYVDMIEEISNQKKIVNVYGGLAKSDIFCQILSDILNKNISSLGFLDTTLIGAAVIASSKENIAIDYSRKVNNYLKKIKIYKPLKEQNRIFQKKYFKYIESENKF